MKYFILSIGLFTSSFSSFVLASPSGDQLYNSSFISVNKGDCAIDNAREFDPVLESFKILLPAAAMDAKAGSLNGFFYYNMLGASWGRMSAARVEKPGILLVDHTTIFTKILLGLTDEADLRLTLIKTIGVNQLAGLVSISENGTEVFSSTFSCK